jgi:hypothetical protein
MGPEQASGAGSRAFPRFPLRSRVHVWEAPDAGGAVAEPTGCGGASVSL